MEDKTTSTTYMPPHLRPSFSSDSMAKIRPLVSSEISDVYRYTPEALYSFSMLPPNVRVPGMTLWDAHQQGLLGDSIPVAPKVLHIDTGSRESVFKIDSSNKKWYPLLCQEVAEAMDVKRVDIMEKKSGSLLKTFKIGQVYGMQSSDLSILVRTECRPRDVTKSSNLNRAPDHYDPRIQVYSLQLASKIGALISDEIEDESKWAGDISHLKSYYNVIPLVASAINDHELYEPEGSRDAFMHEAGMFYPSKMVDQVSHRVSECVQSAITSFEPKEGSPVRKQVAKHIGGLLGTCELFEWIRNVHDKIWAWANLRSDKYRVNPHALCSSSDSDINDMGTDTDGSSSSSDSDDGYGSISDGDDRDSYGRLVVSSRHTVTPRRVTSSHTLAYGSSRRMPTFESSESIGSSSSSDDDSGGDGSGYYFVGDEIDRDAGMDDFDDVDPVISSLLTSSASSSSSSSSSPSPKSSSSSSSSAESSSKIGLPYNVFRDKVISHPELIEYLRSRSRTEAEIEAYKKRGSGIFPTTCPSAIGTGMTLEELNRVSCYLALYKHATIYKKSKLCKDRVTKVTDHVYYDKEGVYLLTDKSRASSTINRALEEIEADVDTVLGAALIGMYGEDLGEPCKPTVAAEEDIDGCERLVRLAKGTSTLQMIHRMNSSKTAKAESQGRYERLYRQGRDARGPGDYASEERGRDIHILPHGTTYSSDVARRAFGLGTGTSTRDHKGDTTYPLSRGPGDYADVQTAKFKNMWHQQSDDVHLFFSRDEEHLLLAPHDKIIGSVLPTGATSNEVGRFIRMHSLILPSDGNPAGRILSSIDGTRQYSFSADMTKLNGKAIIGSMAELKSPAGFTIYSLPVDCTSED